MQHMQLDGVLSQTATRTVTMATLQATHLRDPHGHDVARADGMPAFQEELTYLREVRQPFIGPVPSFRSQDRCKGGWEATGERSDQGEVMLQNSVLAGPTRWG